MEHLDIADIISFEVVDGEIRAKIGDALTNLGIDQDVALWGTSGFYSAPDVPTPGLGAPQCLFVYDGNQKRVLATRDNRHASLVGEMKEGDRTIVSGDARIFMKKAEKQVTLYTEGDNSMLVNLDGANNSLMLMNGGSFIEITPDKVQIGVNGGGIIEVNADGITFMGGTFACNTAGGVFGITATSAKGSVCIAAPMPVGAPTAPGGLVPTSDKWVFSA